MKLDAFLAACATAISLATFTPSLAAADEPAADLAPFPAAAAGQTQHVIRLAAQSDEELLKVEVIVGKTMTVDCNRHAFGGSLEERTAEGWGYTYYVLDSLGQSVSTLIGCAPGSEREAFVRCTDEALLRYNSRMPLVVYTPSDVEVRYRIWRADAEQTVD